MHLLAAIATALALPGFAPVAQEPSGGLLYAGTFPGTVRQGYVYLPPSFSRSTRYPVVYLLHGLPGSPTEYVDGTQLGTYADAAISGGRLRPFIAVIPAAGDDERYDGEWAGPWETSLVKQVVPFVDANLPTVATPAGRVLAGLSAGGYGAFDIGLRNLGMFGEVASWSGYFHPLRDGPFTHASKATLDANDPTKLARAKVALIRRAGVRFFVSTGPAHSHWFTPADSIDFAQELKELGLPVELKKFLTTHDPWRTQLDAGLVWALHPG